MNQSPPAPVSNRDWPSNEPGPYIDAPTIKASIPPRIVSLLKTDGSTEEEAQQKYYRWVDCVGNNYRGDFADFGSNVWRRSWIHRAVIASDGKCYYTGREIDWSKIGKKDGRDAAMAPSIDHDRDLQQPEYRLTYIRLNRSKQDMKLAEWIALAAEVENYRKPR